MGTMQTAVKQIILNTPTTTKKQYELKDKAAFSTIITTIQATVTRIRNIRDLFIM